VITSTRMARWLGNDLPRRAGRRRWSLWRLWMPTVGCWIEGTREIVVRGAVVMHGYYRNPEATEAVSRFGCITRDIGYLDEDGYLFIVDRAKDMIITGGFNVYSAEVEQALMPTRQSGTAQLSGYLMRSGGAVTAWWW